MRPWLLRPDNFTPLVRTPWAGRQLTTGIKAPWVDSAAQAIGESWELSAGAEFPSHLFERSGTLRQSIEQDPQAWLGIEADMGRTSTALLVKLLAADQPLSVQIHPDDDYSGLDATESGKPECWYVLDAKPGAGLYLGLRAGVHRADMQAALAMDRGVEELLNFVEVAVGDFFLIPAGTAHAIGAGVTLVEPQRVLPDMRGVTYRYWDWARRYDEHGLLDPSGQARALHVDDALRVTAWRGLRGDAFVDAVRCRMGSARLDQPAEKHWLCGSCGGIVSEHLRVARIAGTGPLSWDLQRRLHALTVVEGEISIRQQANEEAVVVPAGMTAALPALCSPVSFELKRAHAILSAVES